MSEDETAAALAWWEAKHEKKVDRLRKKLWKKGLNHDEITEKADELSALLQSQRDHMANVMDGLIEIDPHPGYWSPSDRSYRPSQVDPLVKGAARATGLTAKVVKRGKTMTRAQYDAEIEATP